MYADDLELYSSALSSAREALSSASVSKADWPEELRQGDGDGNGNGLVGREMKKMEDEMDPSMAAFLA